MKREIKSHVTGETIFAHDVENNDTKTTVEAAVKSGANLAYAKLSGVNLACAKLSGAKLSGAKLEEGKKISNSERPVFQISCIGSRCATLTAYLTKEGILLRAGCFFGSIPEFLDKLKKTHAGNNHEIEYNAALKLIETHFELWGKK